MFPKITFWFLFVLISVGSVAQSDLAPTYLRCEYKVNPVTDVAHPRLSWELTSKATNQFQSAYHILVATSPALLREGKADLWDSQLIKTSATAQISYAGKALASRQLCYWKVRSWDKNNQPGPWSEVATWEMGLLHKTDWKADFISLNLNHLGKGKEYHLPPAPFFRKEISVNTPVKKARLYVTALGLYEFQINGKKIGKDYFTPGWTDYNKRLYYQVYDVSKELKQGKNALGSIISYGWYAGYLGYALLVGNPVVKNFYGDVPALKAQLEIEYANGQKETIATDNTWKANYGPIIESDILNGEVYNANKELTGWNQASYKEADWKSIAVIADKPDRQLEVYPGVPVKEITTLTPKSIKVIGKDKYLVDLGQNFAGIIRVKLKAAKGDSVLFRFGEMLYPDGKLMTENLRKARGTDLYIAKGLPEGETYQPRFTYHGFQYVQIEGLKIPLQKSDLVGIVLSSATAQVGTFETDNPFVNQLYHNIIWTQQSNYFEIPTDCPQRDERLAWTGDAQAYVKSATFNNDIAAFGTKWLVDLNDALLPNGAYPLYAPAPSVRKTDTYSPGWMEAGIIYPYQIFRSYGDTQLLKRHWPEMKRFMAFLETKSKGEYVFKETAFAEIDPKGGFGDWLSVGKKTPPDMLATMYYAYSASLMQEMAEAIGESQDAQQFRTVAAKVRKAFLQHYTDTNGKFKCNAAAYGNGRGYVDGEQGFEGHTQTAYANALYMNLLDSAHAVKAATWLNELVVNNGNKLTTGFLGVRPMLPSLSRMGYTPTAYKLLFQKEYPSWGFEIENGANTIWERWNSFTKEGGFPAGMNSFNHYAFGSICEWMFETMAGIQETAPAFKSFVIQPEMGLGVNRLKATYRSMSGNIVSSWQKTLSGTSLMVEIPVNTSATICVPSHTPITLNGKPVPSSLLRSQWLNGKLQTVLSVGSGKYNFHW
ncbi:family 78 glycoside hydrolase catalytic domain [Runella sp. MFBS21]|uniref:alpha-L-rhamnosidase n=1 Tax=Runella sp. MFBS21 TaxID=3034018 RepID=UPI0023F73AB1|nr:alpha-L-rhamnosidase [Runella sp. MFBS21]MDF7820252.1 family 78 glycoside hydrolase catalytic domain [Runella sp. MFBS21]